MDRPVRITIAVIVGVTLAVLGFDAVWAVLYGAHATISVVITHYSGEYPIIPFLFGFLMAHFFAQDTKI